METQHNIIVQNRRDVKFEFSIRRKITVIQGDSATGKSTLCDMVSNASIPGFTGITISCDVPVKILRHSEYKYVLENTGGNIYMLDEDFPYLKTKEFAESVLKSDNCFIIITRELLSSIPHSYKEIYGIKASGKYHTLQRLYPDYDAFMEKDKIVTEDKDAGFQYYQYYFGDKVSTSDGNSNLSKYGSGDTLLIGDGSAIGAYIRDMQITGSAMYLPESFEWKLLTNGMFRNIEHADMLLNNPEALATTQYASVEQYCTELLTDITRNSPAQYSKSKLNPCYVNECCCKGTKCEFFTRNKKTENCTSNCSTATEKPNKIEL